MAIHSVGLAGERAADEPGRFGDLPGMVYPLPHRRIWPPSGSTAGLYQRRKASCFTQKPLHVSMMSYRHLTIRSTGRMARLSRGLQSQPARQSQCAGELKR